LVVRQRDVDNELINITNEIKNKHSITVVSGICCIEDVNEKLRIQGESKYSFTSCGVLKFAFLFKILFLKSLSKVSTPILNTTGI
ncbi:hypothetical protein ACTPEM_22990, partial [Clostridioides difficile]